MKQSLNKLLFLGLLIFGIAKAGLVKAVCPICVAAIAGGLGLSRWIGVDDIISSIWIGALILATVIWTLNWMKAKNWRFPYSGLVVFLAYYLLIFVPLWTTGILGHPANKVFGIDKIIFGTAIGTIFFLLSNQLYNYLKKKNNDKPYFPYQKVVQPFVILAVLSLIFYILIIQRWI